MVTIDAAPSSRDSIAVTRPSGLAASAAPPCPSRGATRTVAAIAKRELRLRLFRVVRSGLATIFDSLQRHHATCVVHTGPGSSPWPPIPARTVGRPTPHWALYNQRQSYRFSNRNANFPLILEF